jgi:putative FmdB family regulatory protein
MPIYEYRCEACGHELEVIQKMTDEPLSDCPECGAPSLKKLLSAPGFRLKGSGWYETDFKKAGAKKNIHESSGDGAKLSGAKSEGEAAKPSAAKAADAVAGTSTAKSS